MLRHRLLVATLALLAALPVTAQVGDDSIVEAREALRKKDKARLSALRNTVVNARHPLRPQGELSKEPRAGLAPHRHGD